MSVCSSTRQQRGKRLEFLDLDAASLAIDSTCHLLRLMRVCVSLSICMCVDDSCRRETTQREEREKKERRKRDEREKKDGCKRAEREQKERDALDDCQEATTKSSRFHALSLTSNNFDEQHSRARDQQDWSTHEHTPARNTHEASAHATQGQTRGAHAKYHSIGKGLVTPCPPPDTHTLLNLVAHMTQDSLAVTRLPLLTHTHITKGAWCVCALVFLCVLVF